MSERPPFTIVVAAWRDIEAAARSVRDEVFVREQGVPIELEHDDNDADCLHVLARNAAAEPIGTGRLLPDGHIGRMAVLAAWRGSGVGRMMLFALIEAAKNRGDAAVVLNAQVSALGFYERQGFNAFGDRFREAGIEHQSMRLMLGKA